MCVFNSLRVISILVKASAKRKALCGHMRACNINFINNNGKLRAALDIGSHSTVIVLNFKRSLFVNMEKLKPKCYVI